MGKEYALRALTALTGEASLDKIKSWLKPYLNMATPQAAEKLKTAARNAHRRITAGGYDKEVNDAKITANIYGYTVTLSRTDTGWRGGREYPAAKPETVTVLGKLGINFAMTAQVIRVIGAVADIEQAQEEAVLLVDDIL